jgi:hypothetical protein
MTYSSVLSHAGNNVCVAGGKQQVPHLPKTLFEMIVVFLGYGFM